MCVAAHRDLGFALTELGRLEEAELAYRDAVQLEPTHAVAHQCLGELLRKRGERDEARLCFETALRLNPALNQSRLGLGQVLEESGEFDLAARCYEEAIGRSPAPAGIYMRLGAVLWKAGDSPQALEAFERAVQGVAASAEAFYNLGCVQLELEQFEAAEGSAQEALRLRPGFAEALLLCAAAVAASGAIAEAAELLGEPRGPTLGADARTNTEVALFDGSLDAGAASGVGAPPSAAVVSDVDVPPNAPAVSDTGVSRNPAGAQRYWLLATRLLNSRLFDPARRCLEAAVHADPTAVMPHHMLSALSGANPDHPIEGYVRQLFDASAATFDRELVSKLGYDIPKQLVSAVLDVMGTPEGRWDVLDVGCGTGLVGAEIARYSRRLVGVDVAPNMIHRARDRGVYTDLQCVDIMAALSSEAVTNNRFHVVTAADVFIYVGKLEEVIPAIRRVLRPGGTFAFSAEAVESIPEATSFECRLGIMGRYAHGADYLRHLAALHEFRIELLRPARIRCEHRRPVEGWLTVWRVPN
jgi:predicted TPR repeat methyltransferase